MGYVAIKGGEEAIAEASRAMEFVRVSEGKDQPLTLAQIQTQMRWLHSRVLSEGGLYSPELAVLSRGETGALLALAYTTMRGYGDTHPNIAELRVGYLPVCLPHPVTGEPQEIGEVLMTECEVLAMWESPTEGEKPCFTLGYGACFGHNEVKAIAMAILDRCLQSGRDRGITAPAEDPEFVLLHCDGVDSMGFTTHWKLPHYVTFQSYLDRLRATQQRHKEGGA